MSTEMIYENNREEVNMLMLFWQFVYLPNKPFKFIDKYFPHVGMTDMELLLYSHGMGCLNQLSMHSCHFSGVMCLA